MATTALEVPRPRIGFRAIALLAAASLLLAVTSVSAWRFIAPDVSHEARLGPASSFAPGSVTSFLYDGEHLEPFTRSAPSAVWGWPATYPLPAGEFVHVVRLPDGQLRVLSGVSPHLRQTVLWFPDAVIEVGDNRGVFGDDFSFWMVDGTRIFGPSPRDLPTYPYRIEEDGALVIDLSEPVDGEWLPDRRARQLPPSYDVLDPNWPTSGWPSAAVN